MSQTTTTVVAGPRNGLTVEKIRAEIEKTPLKKSREMEVSNKSKVVIEGYDFTGADKPDGKQLNIENCVDVTVRRCKFGKKTTKGQGLNISGSKTKRINVEYCWFEDFSFDDENGGEPFRFGNSQHSGLSFESTISKSVFIKCHSDPEIISNKTANNRAEDCFVIDCDGNFTQRHSGFGKYLHNYFKGNCGIRLLGYGNEVGYNCFENNTNTGKRAPIGLWYGAVEKDPNWKDAKTISGKAGKSHAIYVVPTNNNIHDNEYKNCKATVVEVKGKSLKPRNNTLKNNVKVDKFTFEKVPQQPPAASIPCTICGDTNNDVQHWEMDLCAKDKTRFDNLRQRYIEYEDMQKSASKVKDISYDTPAISEPTPTDLPE